MADVRNLIVSTLKADAQLSGAGKLGNSSLIGKPSVAPYGIYNAFPPEEPDFPLLTYQHITETGRRPRIIIIQFTAWGGVPENILDRVYMLFHRQESVFSTATDFAVFACFWDWSGPDINDANHRVWVKSHRYLLKAYKK